MCRLRFRNPPLTPISIYCDERRKTAPRGKHPVRLRKNFDERRWEFFRRCWTPRAIKKISDKKRSQYATDVVATARAIWGNVRPHTHLFPDLTSDSRLIRVVDSRGAYSTWNLFDGASMCVLNLSGELQEIYYCCCTVVYNRVRPTTHSYCVQEL